MSCPLPLRPRSCPRFDYFLPKPIARRIAFLYFSISQNPEESLRFELELQTGRQYYFILFYLFRIRWNVFREEGFSSNARNDLIVGRRHVAE